MRFLRRKKPDSPSSVIRFLRTEETATATYHVYTGTDRQAALDFLRETPVKEELVYNIVETPEGNLGRDLIYIFREPDGTPVELVSRPPNPHPTPSSARCAWCEFFIIPYKVPLNDQLAGGAKVYLTINDLLNLVKTGGGFRCDACSMLQCAVCSGLASSDGQAGRPKCRACNGELSVHMKWGVDIRAPQKKAVTAPNGTDEQIIEFPADPWGDEMWGLAPLRVPWNIDVIRFLARTPLPHLWPDDSRYRNYIGSGDRAQRMLRAGWINMFLHHPNPDVVLQCLRDAPPATMLSLVSFADLLASPTAEPHVKEEAARTFWRLDEGSARYTLNVLLSRGIVRSNYDTDSVHNALMKLRATCPPERIGWFNAQQASPEED